MTASASPSASFTPRRIVLLIGLASLALLAGAWFFELAWGLRPCKLCLEQRWPHYAALGVAAAGLALARTMAQQRMALALLAGLMLWSTGLAAYHAGVEWGLFAGPNDCGGAPAQPAAGMADFMRQLETTRVVSCTEAAWRLLGLSLAGWNALASLGLLAAGIYAFVRRAR